jgi:hypothetical protein
MSTDKYYTKNNYKVENGCAHGTVYKLGVDGHFTKMKLIFYRRSCLP